MKMKITDTDTTLYFIGFFVGFEKYGIDVFYNRKFQKWLVQYSTDAELLNTDTEQFQFNEDGFITNVKFTPFENSIALLEVDFIEEEFRRLAFFDLTKLKPTHIRVIKTYERYLKEKLNQPQQPKTSDIDDVNTPEAPQQNNTKIPDEINTHPKYNPNLWNEKCYNLFKYIFDNYYNGKKRQLTNIWFYLKEYHSPDYVLKVTKDNYVIFINENYNISITNFDKAPIKYEDKEKGTMNEHRINFEHSLK